MNECTSAGLRPRRCHNRRDKPGVARPQLAMLPQAALIGLQVHRLTLALTEINPRTGRATRGGNI